MQLQKQGGTILAKHVCITATDRRLKLSRQPARLDSAGAGAAGEASERPYSACCSSSQLSFLCICRRGAWLDLGSLPLSLLACLHVRHVLACIAQNCVLPWWLRRSAESTTSSARRPFLTSALTWLSSIQAFQQGWPNHTTPKGPLAFRRLA